MTDPTNSDSGQLLDPLPLADEARLPKGFWQGVDYLLMNAEDVLELMRQDKDTWRLNRFFFVVALVLGALYGCVMGATNLCQGTVLPMNDKLAMIAVSGIKVPLLFLLSVLIVFPPIYVSNAFVGAKLPFRKMVAVMLAAVGMQVTILASMATVALLFAVTSRSYHFIKLMHVVFFVYGGFAGLVFVTRAIRQVAGEAGKATPAILFLGWLLLYGFVGTQLAWTLRPFVGSPNEPFQLFRERDGNVFESIIYSTGQFLVGKDGRELEWSREAGGAPAPHPEEP
ncbi:MAG: hypothetical protein PWP23_984 [Candidatus Sumerlaeota bacterium]|nr:hypothetical protein [Candidatus Sumerlaeota bacterium]